MLLNAKAPPGNVKGWILDAYPANEGEVVVWVITDEGNRVKLIDKFQPEIYVSATQEELERAQSPKYIDVIKKLSINP